MRQNRRFFNDAFHRVRRNSLASSGQNDKDKTVREKNTLVFIRVIGNYKSNLNYITLSPSIV